MAMASELLTRALNHHRAGRYAEADFLYRQILHDWPENVDAMHLMGVLLCQRDQKEAAAQLIVKAIQLRPNRSDFYCSLGNVLYLLGMLKEGGDAYKQAMALSYLKHLPFGFDEILVRAGDPRFTAEAEGAVPDISLYKSQDMQDLFLDRWVFRGFERGVFIDIGAHDGITSSNSWFFEKQRNWTGVCVEPNSAVFKRLSANRAARVIDCCAAGTRGTVKFQRIAGYSEMLSGIADRYSAEHKKRIAEEMQQFGGSSEIVEVPSRTFSDIAEEAGITEVNYLSIDTEGAEFEILKSVDFRKYTIHAVTVEYTNSIRGDLLSYMKGLDFEVLKSIGADMMFLNRKSPFFPAYDKLRSA
jgi:FkbM family methyltransferase